MPHRRHVSTRLTPLTAAGLGLMGMLALAGCQEAPSAPRSATAPLQVAPSFSLVAPSDTTVAGDVTYGMLHGTFRIYNTSIPSTSSGFVSGDTAFVLPGATVTMTGDWQVGPVTNVSYCPTCIIEEYVAWTGGAAANHAAPTNLGLWEGNDYYVNPSPGGDATFASGANPFTFTTRAPAVDGEYYVGSGGSLDYQFDSWITAGGGRPTAGPNAATAFSFVVIADGTPPVISYTGNAGSYTVDQTVAITCTATDALSGVVSSTCADISGPAYTFPLGTNSYSAQATDRLGNVGTGSTSFTVSVTNQSLCRLVEGWVTQGDIANSLCVKLAHSDYRPFVNEVNAQTGKAISTENAAILLKLVAAL